MKALYAAVWAISLVSHAAFAQERPANQAAIVAAAVSSAVTYQAALARADVAIAKSALNDRLLKGEVGEAVSDQTVGRYRHRGGQWLNVSPRLGPQGLDHVRVRLNEAGKPYRLMVDETKFGSSGLSTTTSGDLQMGEKYISGRLLGMSKAYDKVVIQAKSGIQRVKIPNQIGAKTIIPIPLSDSVQVAFWRSHGTGPWLFDGPLELLPKAIAQVKNISDLARSGAEGRIDFRKRIIQVKPTGGMEFEITIRNAADVEKVGGQIAKLPVSAQIKGSLNEPEWKEAFRKGIARELHRANPTWTASKSDFLAQRLIVEAKSTEDLLTKVSFEKALADVRLSRYTLFDAGRSGATSVLIAMPLELGFQLVGDSPVDWSRVAGVGGLAGGSAFAGHALGSVTTSASASAAEMMGLRSASRFANVTGGAVGGGATAILFAYGGYALGYYDIQTANLSAVSGAAGAGAGAAASAVTLGLIATSATAGTGAAISSLSGASATSASLAWLGGGSVASGGLGVAGGTVFLAVGVGVVVIGVTAVVIYGFYLADEHQDNVRLGLTIDYLAKKKTFFVSDAQSNFAR